MSTSIRHDAFDNLAKLVSIHLLGDSVTHVSGEWSDQPSYSVKGLLFGIERLNKPEFELLYYRYVEGRSLENMKSVTGIGSKRTVIKRLEKLREKLLAYVFYFVEQDLVSDLNYIQLKLGSNKWDLIENWFRGDEPEPGLLVTLIKTDDKLQGLLEVLET